MQGEVLGSEVSGSERVTSTLERIRPSKSSQAQVVLDPVGEGLKIATPVWPLQNTVAVNPFWFLRERPFENVAEEISSAIQTAPYMPLDYYLERIEDGRISESALREALLAARQKGYDGPADTVAFKKLLKEKTQSLSPYLTFAEAMSDDGALKDMIRSEIGKYAAAYLDRGQAIAQFPWRGQNFWNAWCQALKHDRSLEASGIDGFRHIVQSLNAKSSSYAIEKMSREMGLVTNVSQVAYIQRLVATVMGWMSQFKYVEWQRSLGYSDDFKIASIDLLAVAMAYDYGLFRFAQEHQPAKVSRWFSLLASWDRRQVDNKKFGLQYTLLLASEISYQKSIAEQISQRKTEGDAECKAQMVFCIDVRSELLRRKIELVDQAIQTIGFAGFFGVPLDYKKIGEKNVGHRLPVLLKSEFEVEECRLEPKAKNESGFLAQIVASSYFKNLRKNALTSFVYVELFGLLYIFKMLKETLPSFGFLTGIKKLPAKFQSLSGGPSQVLVRTRDGNKFDDSKKIERAAAVLKHMGLTEKFAEIVLLVGHGSHTKNNAFASSLDCGACGGHAGDINARFLADLLNERVVRNGLISKGIDIPPSTIFVAAVHETVTDEVFVLDREKIPMGKLNLLTQLELSLKDASVAARGERHGLLSGNLDSRTFVRSENWSEVRPEWGLASNACFIVAPRSRTRGLDLASRSFLHDYDWKKDAISGFKTLELIMTAPMVVTNWINMQYYASTVAPAVYGAGNKVIHNVTNEFGVVEGNGGDLRFGLPIQSVHDGEKYVHEPLRLSVLIEAPVEEIERIINNHEVVKQLVENEWLHLLHLDSSTGSVSRRQKGAKYAAV